MGFLLLIDYQQQQNLLKFNLQVMKPVKLISGVRSELYPLIFHSHLTTESMFEFSHNTSKPNRKSLYSTSVLQLTSSCEVKSLCFSLDDW